MSDKVNEATLKQLAEEMAVAAKDMPAAVTGDAVPPAPGSGVELVTALVAAPPEEIVFSCTACSKPIGPNWIDSCPLCGAFGTVEIGSGSHAKNKNWVGGTGKPQLLSEISSEDHERISTGTRELDRVLGGGLVTGSTVLISGDPGIGKSTLLTQVAAALTTADMTDAETKQAAHPLIVLYVSAEETVAQIKNRSVRLSMESKKLYLVNESDVVVITKYVHEIKPDILIIDSIQTVFLPDTEGNAGSITQVKECAIHFMNVCRSMKIGCFIVAHITKDGSVAGPKMLEHVVDAVLEFHREGQGELRSIRANKNRFGDTNEMALFRMSKDGLHSIENPSELLLEQHHDGDKGVCIGLAALGPRPLAVEVQTLLGPSAIGTAAERSFRRVVVGLSNNRSLQVCAVLQRRLGIDLNREILINVPGGLKELTDPALDLPLALALVSYVLDISLPPSFICWGEIGLAGEIRPVSYSASRIKAAKLLNFAMVMGPIAPSYETSTIDTDDEESGYFPVATLEEAFDALDFDISVAKPKRAKLRRKKPSPKA